MKKIWDKYGAEISIAVILFIAWKVRGLIFGTINITETVSDKIASYAADAKETAKKSTQKAQIKTVNPGASDTDLETFENDANQLAAYLGTDGRVTKNWFVADATGALSVARKYSRRIFRTQPNGHIVDLGKRKDALRLPVLYKFYSEATNGRNMQAVLDSAMRGATSEISSIYFKYVK